MSDEPQVEIKVRDNGPYKVTGPVRLVDADGDVWDVPADRPIALCRCGHSRTKPFCDASHKEAGFESCARAAAVLSSGDSTRAVHAGLPRPEQGAPFLPGPVLAAPFHAAGAADAAPYRYGRYGNPTWTAYEAAIAELEGGDALVFSSGAAAVSAVLSLLRPGDVAVLPSDAYPSARDAAARYAHGVELRLVPTDERAVREALPGARLVWVETPSNPSLDVLGVEPLARDVHAAGALLAVDGTLATPLRQRSLDLGADIAVASASKSLTGHSDLVLGTVATRDAELLEQLRAWRTTVGAIPGPLEVWLAHRSLATLAVRLERQETNARALQEALDGHPAVSGARWPGVRRRRRLRAGIRGARDALPGGHEARRRGHELRRRPLLRRAPRPVGDRRRRAGVRAASCGIEDAEDLVADVLRALDAVA